MIRPLKNANPENALNACLGACRTKAPVGPGIIFSKFEFKPIGMGHGLT